MPARSYVAVIDDDPSLCRSYERLLRNVGFAPISYPSAEEYLEDGMKIPFACLLVDVHLGGMSGIELQRRLKACSIRTPIICITASDDPDLRAEALSSGCSAFFRKNDAGSEIIAAIHRLVREH